VEAGRGDQVEEVLPVGAVPAEAGVGLEVDPGGPAGDAGGGDDVVEGPGGRRGDVDVAGQGGGEVVARDVQPGEDPTLEPRVAQGDGLRLLGGTEPGIEVLF